MKKHAALPDFFVDLHDIDASIRLDMKYFTGDNFVGAVINGYLAERCLLTKPAALALQRVQHQLNTFGLGLMVFDAYRPQRAVDHFIEWCGSPGECPTQGRFFPGLNKKDLFNQGYLIKHSSHSRGSTVDLTIIDLADGLPLDMGTEFDFFGPESWFDDEHLSGQVRANRLLLQTVMMQHGFVPFHQEWWHFTLDGEPFTDQYFDLPIT